MKISLNWLRELVELPAAPISSRGPGAHRQGLEVEGSVAKGRELAGVLVARCWISSRTRTPTSCASCACARAFRGKRGLRAPNVPPAGNRVCWAPPGARLPGGHTLDAREIRGVFSPGMICSEPEMGLAEEADGS